MNDPTCSVNIRDVPTQTAQQFRAFKAIHGFRTTALALNALLLIEEEWRRMGMGAMGLPEGAEKS